MSRYIKPIELKAHALRYVRTQPHFHYGDWDNMCISGKELDEIIDTCPTADVEEVRHGKWKRGDMPTYGGYKCSECGENTLHYNAKYCPECGADMRGKNNGKE